MKSGGEEKVSRAGGCFLVLDRNLVLLIPSNIVVIRKLEKESAPGRKEFQDETDQKQTFRK